MAGIEDEQAAVVICRVDSTNFDIWLNQNRQIVIPVCEIGFQRLYAIDLQRVFLASFVKGFARERRALAGRTQDRIEMIYYKLLLSITVIAFLLAQADAKPIDPLNPSQLGESMSMPLDQELIHVNVTGAWSFDLLGKAPEKMKLYLIQNKDVIAGRGVINRGNETEKATANGSISGEQMSLNVMPEGVSDLYRLNLSLSSLAAGTYTACMADGSSRSGKVTFAVSANIFQAETVAEDDSGADADSAAATPAWL
jgi:hypothetical protein